LLAFKEKKKKIELNGELKEKEHFYLHF